MKINKISLYNFNSYEGHNEFDFESRDKSKNIVLIGGKNGAGKTSLFTAIKIALYGPLAFGYVGPNAHYIAKIKDCINSKAFQKNEVNAEVQLTLSLMVEREYKEYVITRNWKYINQKLEETYTVLEEGKQLANQELSYFQNYLQGLIPPDLFEFFLFDGEEVGNIFSSNSYNSYIKNAIYTLCGIDIFEIIRKFTSGYSSKANGEADDELYDQYEQLKGLAEKLEDKLSLLKEQLDEEQIKYEQIEVDLFDLETAYKNAGGITQEERDELASEYESAEKIKSETSLKIKMFVEGLMPFFIVGEFADQISKQLFMQERRDAYKYVKNSISTSVLKNALQGKSELKAEDIEIFINEVLNMLKPDEKSEGEQSIHDLSKEELTRVTGLIANLRAIDSEELIEMINKKRHASERMMEINKILKSAMTDEDANRYATKENALLKKREESSRVITDKQEELVSVEEEHSVVEQQKIKALQALKENAQNKHVYELSSGMASIMESILKSKTISIRKDLEKKVVRNLKRIYRKNNLITLIEIDENFEFHLYQNAEYSVADLLHLYRNLGQENFSDEIGNTGLDFLINKFSVNNVGELRQSFELANKDEIINLYKRIDISRLSKGERQIFILALYWAIIEVSGQDIPFIIDTPYARIDANHRKEISEKFFPNISKQVVILSTDEEINEEYYRILKPHISKEYLLINDESQNKTSIEQHYFFGSEKR
mgnify:FL=1